MKKEGAIEEVHATKVPGMKEPGATRGAEGTEEKKEGGRAAVCPDGWWSCAVMTTTKTRKMQEERQRKGQVKPVREKEG